MSENNNLVCSCFGKPTLIFSCSGGSDVGGLSDRSARKLTQDGVGKMYCLAGIGGGVQSILETTREADRLIAIDGCPMDCAKKTLEHAGFELSFHLRLSELGLKKGSSPSTDENMNLVCQAVANGLPALPR